MEIYKADMAGLTAKEARDRRRWWHYSARAVLIFNSLTSDNAGEPPSHVEVRDGKKIVISESIEPFWPFWIRWPIQDLVKLYRATKPIRKPV
jgi:hypothetical protein